MFASLLFVTNACQKDEIADDTPSTERPILSFSKTAAENALDFFDPYFAVNNNPNVNPSAANDNQTVSDSLLQEIIHELSKENNAHEFVTRTTELIGYPIWSKSTLHKDFVNAPNVSIGLTPFAFLDGGETNSILMTLKIDSNYYFNVLSRDYADFITDSTTISQLNLDTELVNTLEAKKGLYYTYDERIFDPLKAESSSISGIQIQDFNLSNSNSGGSPQYTMFVYFSITCSCENMFNGSSGSGTIITILHITPDVGGPGGTTGNSDTGSGGNSGSGGGGSFNPHDDGNGSDPDFEDESEFDPNFNDALNGFEDRVINKALAQLGVFNLELTGDEQEMILDFIEYLDSTNPAFIPDPEQAFHEYLLATDPGYAEFVAEFASMSPWMWEIMKELVIEAIIEFAKKNAKITIAEDVIEGMRAINNRDYQEFIKTITNSAFQNSPHLKGLRALFTSGRLFQKVRFIWGKFNEMIKEVGGDIVSKIFNALNKNFSFLENMDWTGNKGINLTGINLKEVFDDLAEDFGVGAAVSDGQAGFYIQIGDIFINWYPVSGSTNGPTIAIYKCNIPGCSGPPIDGAMGENVTALYKFRQMPG
ncbi:MAG: hypothetical protein R3E32_03280 [Chitinophagales bacterium]